MFPLSAHGFIRMGRDSIRPQALVKEIGARITSSKPSAFRVESQTLYFEGGLLRPVLSTNLLVPFSKGTIEVSEQGTDLIASYKVAFNEILIAGTLLALLLAFMSHERSGNYSIIVFAGFWLLFVGGNYLIGVVRFRSMLRDASRKAAMNTSLSSEAEHQASS